MRVREGLIDEWRRTQQELAAKCLQTPLPRAPTIVVGADVAFSRDKTRAFAVAVVYDIERRAVVEEQSASLPLEVPYVPTFLSFREGPVLLAAIGKLKTAWDAICFDGQGLAHPRRCGLATHLGVVLDRPTCGFAKSRLIGEHDEPGPNRGDCVPLVDRGETIGIVLRTRDRVRPIYVSVGHRMTLDDAAALALRCAIKRIPEPTRLADALVGDVAHA